MLSEPSSRLSICERAFPAFCRCLFQVRAEKVFNFLLSDRSRGLAEEQGGSVGAAELPQAHYLLGYFSDCAERATRSEKAAGSVAGLEDICDHLAKGLLISLKQVFCVVEDEEDFLVLEMLDYTR